MYTSVPPQFILSENKPLKPPEKSFALEKSMFLGCCLENFSFAKIITIITILVIITIITNITIITIITVGEDDGPVSNSFEQLPAQTRGRLLEPKV